MKWEQIRERYPHKWILVEAINAKTKSKERVLEELRVIESYTDVSKALTIYKKLHTQAPVREYYVVHTDNKHLKIYERYWVGIRATL